MKSFFMKSLYDDQSDMLSISNTLIYLSIAVNLFWYLSNAGLKSGAR